ncbi:MAG: FG-GAP-like repeat-containing protein [Flavisolibacter sp.]
MIKYSGLLAILTIFVGFSVFSQPIIKSFSPSGGPVGTIVTLKGKGFDTVASHNIIFFGAVRSIASASTDSTIVTAVPSGTSYQPVTVTNNSGTAYSLLPFVVTFAGASGPFTSSSFLPKIDVTTSYYPHALSIADFNNDGKPDVVVAKGSSATVSVLTNTSSNGAISFAAPKELTAAGNSHECSATGDLDGDGKIDLVTANTWNTNTISVFRNTTINTTISFASKIDLATDSSAYSVAINDLDGDGKPDIIVANNASNKISLYKNRSTAGNILFDNRIDLLAGTNPFSIAVNDLDGDGLPELIYTTQNTSSNLSVMKNNSVKDSLSFDAPIVLANFPAPFVVAVGDLDGDGLPDLAAASGGDLVIVKKNLSTPGNLAFSGLQLSYATASYANGVAIADIDGDGKPDLAVSNRMSNNISLFRNTGSPGSISFESRVDYAVGELPIYLAVADLNGDQRPDIISANSSSTFISILTNIIGANVAPTVQSFSPASGVQGTSVVIKGTNFNGTISVTFGGVRAASFTVNSDSTITAVVAQGNSGAVAVTTPTGSASQPGFNFTGPTITSFTPSTGVSGTTVNIYGTNFTNASSVKFGGTPAAAFTVNVPTYITAVVGTGASGDVSVTTPNGTATLSGFSYGAPVITSVDPRSAPVGATVLIQGKNFSATASDNIVFFGSVKARVDSASSNLLKLTVPAGARYGPITVTVNRLTAYSSMFFSISFADSTALSAGSFSNVGSYSAGNYPSAVTICDLNDDGMPDLMTANALGNSISVIKNISTVGNISFLQKVDLPAGTDTKKTVTGDLDGDGKPDVVAVNFNSGNASTISVFRNTSTASTISFAAKTDYATGNGTFGLAIGDINGDGKPDVVTSSGNSGFFSIFLNTTAATGTISFAPRQDIINLNHADNLALADMDGDGRTDIVLAEMAASAVSVYRNISSGGNLQLDGRTAFAVGAGPFSVEVADLDQDGKLDVIARGYSAIFVLKNNSNTGALALQPVYDFPLSTMNASLSDLNGDGRPDILLGQSTTGIISMMENKTVASGPIAFGNHVDLKPGNFDTFVAAGDLDGDGKPELTAANTLLYTVTIYSNKSGAPRIDSSSAATIRSGDTLQLTGGDFTGASSVKFGGTPAASFKVNDATHMEAVVGGGASGNITVTTPKGTADYPGIKFIPVIKVNGPSTVCGDASVPLTSSADANNQWYKNNAIIAGANAKTYNVVTTGNYTVRTTSNGVTTTSVTGVDITVTSVPTPSITVNGSSLVSSAASGNQWFLNGAAIQGATAQTYQPTQSGDYTVQASVNGCLSATSPARSFVITALIDLPNGQFIHLYPNPVVDQLVIRYQLNNTNVITLEIFDGNGRWIKTVKGLHSGDVVHTEELSAGMYLIKIESKGHSFGTMKMIKIE